MFNIAVCDDNKTICSQIESTLLAYAEKNLLKINVTIFYDGESYINYTEKGNNFDLVYLDIQMNSLNGVEVGKIIRKVRKDYSTEIVYISGKDEYDRLLFDLQPLHFIPKPINPNSVIEDLKLAMERSKKSFDFFKYKKGNEFFKIPVNDIIYFESQSREMKIVLKDSEDYFYGSMEDITQTFTKFQFVKIHRSYLINYDHARIFKYDEVKMSNGDVLPISQSKRKEIRELQIDAE